MIILTLSPPPLFLSFRSKPFFSTASYPLLTRPCSATFCYLNLNLPSTVLYTYTGKGVKIPTWLNVCKKLAISRLPNSDKHLPQSPFIAQFFLDDDILHWLLWVLSFYALPPQGSLIFSSTIAYHSDRPPVIVNINQYLFPGFVSRFLSSSFSFHLSQDNHLWPSLFPPSSYTPYTPAPDPLGIAL